MAEGYDSHFHSIGDGTSREVLKMIAKAKKQKPTMGEVHVGLYRRPIHIEWFWLVTLATNFSRRPIQSGWRFVSASVLVANYSFPGVCSILG